MLYSSWSMLTVSSLIFSIYTIDLRNGEIFKHQSIFITKTQHQSPLSSVPLVARKQEIGKFRCHKKRIGWFRKKSCQNSIFSIWTTWARNLMLKIWKFSTISALSSSTGCGFSLAKIFRARELSVVDTLFKTNPRAYLIIVSRYIYGLHTRP